MSRALPIHPRTGLQALGLIGDKPVWPIAGGDGTGHNPVLTRLLDQREAQETFVDQLLGRVAEENRDLVDAERSNLEAARQRIGELDAQIEPLEQFEQARSAHRSRVPEPPRRQPQQQDQGDDQERGQRLGAQPREMKYRSKGHFIVDYIRSQGFPGEQLKPDADAQQRVAAALGRAAGDVAPGVHQTTEDTPGLLPEPIVGQILTDIDGTRPFIQSVGVQSMSGIPGKVFHRPHVTQHTQVDEQTAEKAELVSREFKVEGIPFTKHTFGGWLNVSRQDIDWTSPSAWNALISDLQMEYGEDTEDTIGAAFADTVTQSQEIANADQDNLDAWVDALYLAAVQAATAGGTKRARARRLPNHIWASIDMWASLGSLLTIHKLRNVNAAGDATPTAFNGDILTIPRTMVPGFASGTLIVGRDDKFEVYEERIGLLQAVEPKVLGVEVAYGGYAAWGNLDPTSFAKLTVAAAA